MYKHDYWKKEKKMGRWVKHFFHGWLRFLCSLHSAFTYILHSAAIFPELVS